MAARTRSLARVADAEDSKWHDPALGPAAAGWTVGAVIWLAEQRWVPAVLPEVLASWLVRDSGRDFPACVSAIELASAAEASNGRGTPPLVQGLTDAQSGRLAVALFVGGALLLCWGAHRNRQAWASLHGQTAALQEREAQLLRWQVYLASQWEAVRDAADRNNAPRRDDRGGGADE